MSPLLSSLKTFSLTDALTLVPRFLRDPQKFYWEIENNVGLGHKTVGLALSSIVFLAIYGAVTGAASSGLQALSSAIKMPLLFVATMAFCLPALYFFSLAVLGTRLTGHQALTVVLSGIGVTAFLLLGLSPVTLFFVLTSRDHAFFQLLTVAFVAVSGYVGLYFLWRGMNLVDPYRNEPVQRLAGWILRAWTVLYGFVGSQLAWRLSPIVGDPAQPFVLLQPSRDNFYVDVLRAVGRVSGLGEAGWLAVPLAMVLALAIVAGVWALSAARPARTSNAAGQRPSELTS